MNGFIDVQLVLSDDGENALNFEDTYEGLSDIYYKLEVDKAGGVMLTANADGFEHLARYFLKLARGNKAHGFHTHHTMEFGADPDYQREFTVAVISGTAV